jgi:hypothetical protein
MSRRKAPCPAAALLALLLLAAAGGCGPADKGAKEPVQEEAAQVVDTSTAAEWRANCDLHRQYHNGLIFTAVETTTPDGQRAVAWSTRDRAAYLDLFRALALDGVPELKRRRDLILAEAALAPGGSGIAILPKLDEMVRSLWKEVEAAALRHGVSCRESDAPNAS